jgi:RNA-dependent RNA polymerase
MGVESTEDIPGSCQIRLAGIKGMLSLKVDFPPDKIGIRPSMCKFPSNHKILEVKRVAKANVSRDNKLFSQILLIMHHLRVPNRVFLDLQARAFAEMASEYDIDALELLEDPVDIAEVSKYVRNVVKHGRKGSRVAFSTDEFRVLTKYMTQAKAKINLRCSITLMLGVVDEHGLLEEGELLVGNGMVQGPVLICRSPCNAPGDIQKATAIAGVDKAPYAYLKDTLVFSAKGQRPLPDKLGGGDLDGDEYYVIVSWMC